MPVAGRYVGVFDPAAGREHGLCMIAWSRQRNMIHNKGITSFAGLGPLTRARALLLGPEIVIGL